MPSMRLTAKALSTGILSQPTSLSRSADTRRFPNSGTPLSLVSKQVLSNKQCVGGAFCQTSHEVGIPFGAKRDVDPHPPSLSYQGLLQIAADAVKHLEFKGIARNAVLCSEGLGLVDDFFVMGGQTVIDPALHQNFHQLDVVRIHF